MKWNVLAKDNKDIVKTLLENRGLKTKEGIDEFLNPADPLSYSPTDLLINTVQLKKAVSRIKLAIKNKEPIVVYGDYDADGICATAIMWEALRDLKASAMPFIPLREKEGYGLSKEGIDSILQDKKYGATNGGLVITVDSGIVAHEAVEYAKGKGLDVIIIDHHEKPKKLPSAFATVHTEKLCASGIAFFVANELLATSNQQLATSLELATIATITDLMPLTGVNRSIVKFGLAALNRTSRPGLQAIFKTAGLEKIGTYEIGYMIGPRLNASGRIDSALTALRLLCTKDISKALELAELLNQTNRERQDLLIEQTTHALELSGRRKVESDRIIVLEHDSYHQGIIGLIAGKLTEKYYLPAIVIARGETVSKASARSITGFNIIEAIRESDSLLINAGGHPMAAGFTIETGNIEKFKIKISNYAQTKITPDMLERTLRIDCNLDLDFISLDFYQQLQQFSPFGIGNPEPVFESEVTIDSLRTVGQENKHLKLTVCHPELVSGSIDAIAFNKGELASQMKVGDRIKIAYSLDLNTFNGRQTLQLKIKDIETK